ncbi:MAG TPA: VOC family protein [Solirubrobacterales bacterium]|nr:VOC family protein [Solirubrobacterales bacterium]
MSERTSYEPGTPSWVELSGVPDMDAAESFYRELFGWEIPEQPNSAELGGYRRAKLNGRDVAGASPAMQDGQPCVWATYVSVEDADATLVKVRDAGGQVIVEAMDVMGLGKMAVFTDPTGAVCGIWQPGTFVGAELVNEDGAFGWNELGTRDVPAATEFYGAVFGWTVEEQEMPGMGTYHVWKDGEAVRGGMIDMTGMAPDEAPPHWLVYFTVPDADAAAETTKAAGGQLLNGPIDISVGRIAMLMDAQGAMFAVMAPTDETRENAP